MLVIGMPTKIDIQIVPGSTSNQLRRAGCRSRSAPPVCAAVEISIGSAETRELDIAGADASSLPINLGKDRDEPSYRLARTPRDSAWSARPTGSRSIAAHSNQDRPAKPSSA